MVLDGHESGRFASKCVAHVVIAVNRAFERVGELMKSQKILTSGIAHEICTPLAVLKLELGRIDHPRARQAEANLDDLVRFVGPLTALARLDGFDHSTFEDIDLIELGSSIVAQLAPWSMRTTIHWSSLRRSSPLCCGVPQPC